MLHPRSSYRLPGPAQRPPRPFSDVTIAGPDDLQDLTRFLLAMQPEIDGGRAEEDLLIADAHRLVNRIGGLAFIVRGVRDIEGSLGISFDRPRLSRVYHLIALWNVVLPAKRMTTGHAKSLLREAGEFAQKFGRPLYVEQSGPVDAPKSRLCARHMQVAGVVFAALPVAAEA